MRMVSEEIHLSITQNLLTSFEIIMVLEKKNMIMSLAILLTMKTSLLTMMLQRI